MNKKASTIPSVKAAAEHSAARLKFEKVFRDLTKQAGEAMKPNGVVTPNRDELRNAFCDRWKRECEAAQKSGLSLNGGLMAEWFDGLEKQIEKQQLYAGPITEVSLAKVGFRKRGKRMCSGEMRVTVGKDDVRIEIDRTLVGFTMADVANMASAMHVSRFTTPTKTRSW